MSMGFTDKKVMKALRSCDNNPDRAAEWLFSHMEDPDEDEQPMNVDVGGASAFKNDKPGFYELHGFITHLGTSVHSGHYVCHLKRQGKWIYFNDAKVA
jgi:ubiquitin carboxyl-terminal hydrolase 5/13